MNYNIIFTTADGEKTLVMLVEGRDGDILQLPESSLLFFGSNVAIAALSMTDGSITCVAHNEPATRAFCSGRYNIAEVAADLSIADLEEASREIIFYCCSEQLNSTAIEAMHSALTQGVTLIVCTYMPA